MRLAVIAGIAALIALPVQAQEQQGAEVALRLPVVEGARAAPDCGGLYNLQGQATCMATWLNNLGALADLYIAALPQAGWAHVGGGDNLVVFQHPNDEGGCDILQMIAFYDIELPEEALETAPGYLGFALHTGGDCLTDAGAEEGAAAQQ